MGGKKHPLRVGLAVDSHNVPAWMHRMLQILYDSDYADIVLVARNAAPDMSSQPRQALLYKL